MREAIITLNILIEQIHWEDWQETRPSSSLAQTRLRSAPLNTRVHSYFFHTVLYLITDHRHVSMNNIIFAFVFSPSPFTSKRLKMLFAFLAAVSFSEIKLHSKHFLASNASIQIWPPPFQFLPVQRDLPQFQSSLPFQLSLKWNIITSRHMKINSPEESLSYILNAILSLSSGPFASERFVASMNSFDIWTLMASICLISVTLWDSRRKHTLKSIVPFLSVSKRWNICSTKITAWNICF